MRICEMRAHQKTNPSLHAIRAETRLTVYGAHTSTAGANVFEIDLDIFLPEFWKIVHNFDLARPILMKLVASGVKGR